MNKLFNLLCYDEMINCCTKITATRKTANIMLIFDQLDLFKAVTLS